MALEGRKLFQKLQCLTCHSSTAQARAPVLEGLYRRTVPLRNNRTALADEAYLRESILQPEAKVVAGYEPIMPPYQLSEEDVLKVIAYLKSLRPGDTPPRVEDGTPPALPDAPGKQKK
jgi:cytochrome c oxidase subunit 2